MKITDVEVIPVAVPRAPQGPAYTAVVVLRTDAGIDGIGHAMTSYQAVFPALLSSTQGLANLLLGEDPREPERLYRKMEAITSWHGLGGLLNMAMCAVDVAAWDVAAKACGAPLYRLLGGHRDRVPTYASQRLGKNLSVEELSNTAKELVAQGFGALKMSVGGQPGRMDDVERVGAVRSAVGENIQLMVDAAWAWTPSEAIRVGRALERCRLSWLEDPVPSEDLVGLAEIARCLDTPVTAGERFCGVTPFRDALERQSVDIVMADITRCGGITPFRKVAALSEAFCKPLVSHYYYELSAQLIAAVPNGMIVEYATGTSPLFTGLPELKDGLLVLSQRPGHGLELDHAFVEKHRMQ